MRPPSNSESSDLISQSLWLFLFAFGAIFHVVGIAQPFLGNFAQHQTDYATVVHRWLATGIDPFNPVMRFMANGTNRLFYGDFPLNITLIAWFCKFTGLSIEIVGRGFSALLFFISVFPFKRLIEMTVKDTTIVKWGCFFYLFSPLTLIYGQSFLLEMSALSLGVIAYYYFFSWLEKPRLGTIIAAALFFSLMLATRIYFLPLIMPLFLVACKKFSWKILSMKEAYLFAVLSLALPVAWQLFAGHTAALRGDESSLSDNMRVFGSQDPILMQNKDNLAYFFPAFHYFANKIVTCAGLVFVLMALCLKKVSQGLKLFIVVFMLSFVPLMLFAPRKFIEFEYYFLPFAPLFSLAAGAGAVELTRKFNLNKIMQMGLLLIVVLLSIRFSINPILKIPEEDRGVLEFAKEVQEHVGMNELVIAAHGSSTSFLYYTERDGWHFYPYELGKQAVRNLHDKRGTVIDRMERYRSQGASYFALTLKGEVERKSPQLLMHLRSNYPVLYETESELLFKLEPLSSYPIMNK